MEMCTKKITKDKFKIITGLAVIIAIILMVIAVGMILNFIVFESKGNDSFNNFGTFD